VAMFITATTRMRVRLTDHDVDARMNNLRNRVLQRNQLEGSIIPSHYVLPDDDDEEEQEEEEEAAMHHDAPFIYPLPLLFPSRRSSSSRGEKKKALELAAASHSPGGWFCSVLPRPTSAWPSECVRRCKISDKINGRARDSDSGDESDSPDDDSDDE